MKKTLFLFTFLITLSVDSHSNENIPLQHFFCDSAMTSGSLSPDGKYFASMVPASGPKCAIEEIDDPQAARVLLVIDLENNTSQVLSGTKGKDRLTSFTWISNTRMIFYRGTDDGGLSGLTTCLLYTSPSPRDRG